MEDSKVKMRDLDTCINYIISKDSGHTIPGYIKWGCNECEKMDINCHKYTPLKEVKTKYKNYIFPEYIISNELNLH